MQTQAQGTKDPYKLFPIKKGSLWGYMDGTGKTVIKPQFESAQPFFEGMAVVFKAYNQDTFIPYYIDRTGKTIWYPKLNPLIPEKIKALMEIQYKLGSPSEGLATAYELGSMGYKLGYIDSTGKYVIKPRFHDAGNFSEGLAAVCTQGGCGYIDRNGNLVVKPRFEKARPFSQGLAAVKIGGKYGYIDMNGVTVINPDFDDAGSFYHERAPVKVDGKWGYIDKTGTLTTDTKYHRARPFSEGLAAVGMQNPGSKPDQPLPLVVAKKFRGKWGYLDVTGKELIRMQFDDVSPFSEGLAAVKVGDEWGYIDSKGTIVITPQFNYASEFSGGLALVQFGDKMAYIDKAGKFIWGPAE
jgi:hypothetical protein